jgi:hypothetical protein
VSRRIKRTPASKIAFMPCSVSGGYFISRAREMIQREPGVGLAATEIGLKPDDGDAVLLCETLGGGSAARG